MVTFKDYNGEAPAWCPGCGNFAILNTLKRALVELAWEPHQFAIVSGGGQAGKLPYYLPCNGFAGIPGRALPVATGLRLANHSLPVIVIAGDGDCYGIGGNHLLQAIRSNSKVTLFVHNNQVMALSGGQASPTSREGRSVTSLPYSGTPPAPLSPLALAIALDCGFVARGFAGASGLPALKEIMIAALRHPGFALVDILQNCVSLNRVNTFHWYKDRVYRLEEGYDPSNRESAFARALEWGPRIPTGIFYRHGREPMEAQLPILAKGPLVRQPFVLAVAKEELEYFR